MTAKFNVTATGTILAAPAYGTYRINNIEFTATAPVDVSFYGVGSSEVLTGTYKSVQDFAEAFLNGLRLGTGNGLGITVTGTATIGGEIEYTQHLLSA